MAAARTKTAKLSPVSQLQGVLVVIAVLIVTFVLLRLIPGSPLPRIEAFQSQDSARLGILADADALLIRPLGDGPRTAGEIVEYLPL